MRLVIDTNVIVNASRQGGKAHSKSRQLISDIYSFKYTVYASEKILAEYEDVLSRPNLKVGRFARWRWLRWVRKNAVFIEPNASTQDWVKMTDEDDRIFFDVARCADAKLVTRNFKDYPVSEIVTLIDELY